jgi:hypothetical protein
MLEVNFLWRAEKWVAIAPGQTFTDVHLCIYPASLDEAMKERLEQCYNLAYRMLNEKIGRDCYFPDGPPRCIVCPIRVSSLGTARKALQAMEQDEAIVAPLFASAVMGLVRNRLQPSSGTFLCPRSALSNPGAAVYRRTTTRWGGRRVWIGGRHRGPSRTQEAIFRCFPFYKEMTSTLPKEA